MLKYKKPKYKLTFLIFPKTLQLLRLIVVIFNSWTRLPVAVFVFKTPKQINSYRKQTVCWEKLFSRVFCFFFCCCTLTVEEVTNKEIAAKKSKKEQVAPAGEGERDGELKDREDRDCRGLSVTRTVF